MWPSAELWPRGGGAVSNARIIGWSDDGWPIFHPDDIAAMGDPVDDSIDPGWENFAEHIFGKVEPRQRLRASWLAAMKPAARPVPVGDFTGDSFDIVVEALAGWAIDALRAGEPLVPQISAYDSLWRPVRILEGPQGTPPAWLEFMEIPQVRVPGLPTDNPDVVREVFRHLDIKAAVSIMLTTDDADRPASIPERRGSAVSARRCIVLDSVFSETGDRRFLIIPVTFNGDGEVSVGEMQDSRLMPEGMGMDTSPLASLLP